MMFFWFLFFFFKQKTAYEMRISDWSSDVCSSDLPASGGAGQITHNDLDAYAARKSSVSTVSRGHGAVYAERSDEHAVPVIGLRRKIAQKMQRSEERRLGQEGVSTCTFRWSPYH